MPWGDDPVVDDFSGNDVAVAPPMPTDYTLNSPSPAVPQNPPAPEPDQSPIPGPWNKDPVVGELDDPALGSQAVVMDLINEAAKKDALEGHAVDWKKHYKKPEYPEPKPFDMSLDDVDVGSPSDLIKEQKDYQGKIGEAEQQAKRAALAEQFGGLEQEISKGLPGYGKERNPEHQKLYERMYEFWQGQKKTIDKARKVAGSSGDAMLVNMPDDPDARKVYMDTLRDEWKKLGPISLDEAYGKKKVADLLPWHRAIVGTAEALEVRDAANKISAEMNGETVLTDLERGNARELLTKLALSAEQLKVRGGEGFAAKVLGGTWDMVPFALELATGGGLGAATAKGVAGMGARAAAKLGLEGAAATSLKVGAKLAGWGARGYVQGATAFAPRTAEQSLQRQTQDYTITDDGQFVIDPKSGDKPFTATLKAWSDMSIEAMSEAAGGAIGGAAGKLTRATGRMMPTTSRLMGKVTEKLGEAWMGKTGRTANEFMKEIASKAGYHGVLEEMGEERLGDIMRAVTGVQDFNLKGDKNTIGNRLIASLPDGEQLLQELVQFSIPGAASKMGARAMELVQTDPEMADQLAKMQNPSRNDFKRLGIMDQLDAKERAELAEAVRQARQTPLNAEQQQSAETPNVQTQPEAPVATEAAPAVPESAPAEIAPQAPTEQAEPAPQAEAKSEDLRLPNNAPLRARIEALSPEHRGSLIKEVSNLPEGQREARLDQLLQQVYEGNTDPLTGLPTRRTFEALDKEGKLGPAKMVMDVVGLGVHNDAFDYAAGDALLVGVSGVAKKYLDLVRYGGDELAAHGADMETLRAQGNALNKELRDLTYQFVDSNGNVRTLKGARVVFGLGETAKKAASLMERAKEVASATGIRPAKGQIPGFLVEVDAEGRSGPPKRRSSDTGQERESGLPPADRIGGTEAWDAEPGQPAPAVEDLTKVPRKDLFKRARELGHKPSAALPTTKLIELIQQGAKPKEESNVRGGLREDADEDAKPEAGRKEKEGKPPARQLPKVGEKVKVNPKDDLNGSRRRKAVYGPLQRIEEVNGKKFAVVKADGQEWIVPVEKAERMAGKVAKEEEAARMAKEYTPEQLKQIEKASHDTRVLAAQVVWPLHEQALRKTERDPYRDPAANAELQNLIDVNLRREMGMEGSGRDAQAEVLPFVLEAALQQAEKGTVLPKLKSVEFIGAVGQGDTITLGGQKWTATKESKGGAITLTNEAGDTISFYRNYVPVDKGTKRKRGERKKELRSKQPRPEVKPNVTEAPEPAQPSELKTSAKVVNETDLLGQERARVEGAGGKVEQGQIFDNEVSPELARERKLREAHRQAGGKEFDFGDMAEEPGLPEKPNDDIPFYDPKTDVFQNLPMSMEPGTEPISNHAIIAGMERNFDMKFKYGRVPGEPLGFYKVKDEIARVKGKFWGDLGVHTHEVAHDVDKMTKLSKSVPSELRDELGRLDYDPNQQRVHEGWAEFVRHLLTDDDARDLAPNFYEWFHDEWLPAHPRYAEAFLKTKELINRYRQQGAKARVEQALSWDGEPAKPAGVSKSQFFMEKLKKAWTRGIAQWDDDVVYLRNLEKIARDLGWNPKPGDVGSEYIDALSQTGPSLARTAMEEGVFSMGNQMDKIGPSYVEVFDNINEGNYKDFVIYLFARQAQEAWRHGVNPNITKADADYVYNELKSDVFEDAAKKFTNYQNALIEMLATAGVISHSEADRIIDYWKKYAPLLRIMPEGGGGKRINGKNILDLGKPLFGRKGSGLQVLDPVIAGIERTMKFYMQAAQQQAIERIWRMSQEVEGLGGWITEVAPKMIKQRFSAEEALKQLEALGLEAETVPEDIKAIMLEAFQPLYKGSRSENIGRVIAGDRVRLIQFDPDLYRAVKGMNQVELPRFLDLTIGAGARLVRLGATGINPNFIAPNIVRDYLGFLFQRKESKGAGAVVAPPQMMGAYLWSEVQRLQGKEQNPYVQIFREFGGEMGLSVGLDRKKMQLEVRDMLRHSTVDRVIDIMKSPLESLRSAVSFSEVGPRLAEVVAVFNKHGYTADRLVKMLRMGQRPPTHVIVEALNAGHDVTINYKRGGYYGKYVNRMIPFFNASIQGSDKFIRTWKDNPKRTMLYAGALAAGSLLYWAAKKDEEWYREAPPWLKYGFWTMTDADGKPIARIPRPFEWGWTISAGTEALADAINKRDPKVMKDYVKQMGEALSPNYKPAVITPGLEAIFNWSSFRHAPLVGPDLENRLPEDQYHSYNTELMRQVGKMLRMSPAKLEHLVEGVTGGMYGRVVRPAEAAIKGEKMPAETYGLSGFELRSDYSQTTSDFYDRRNEITQQYNSAKDRAKKDGGKVDPKLQAEHKRFEEIAGLMKDLREGIKDVKDRDERFKHEKYIIGLSRFALGKEALDRYPSLLSGDTADMPEAVKDIRDEYLGRLAYRMSTPRPKREKGEPLEHFQQRREEYKALLDEARDFFDDLDLEKDEMVRLLRAEAKRRGYNTKLWNNTGRSAYGERLWRLRAAVNE